MLSLRYYRITRLAAWLRLFAVMACAGLLVSGCKISDNTSNPKLRFVNLSYDSAAVNIAYGTQGLLIAADVLFEGGTGFADVTDSSTAYKFIKTSDATVLTGSVVPTLSANTYTSLLYYGTADTPSQYIVLDQTATAPASGNVSVRFSNVAPDAGALDVYMTTGSTDLSSATPVTTALALASTTSFSTFASTTLRIFAVPTGTKTVIYDSGTQTAGNQEVFDFAFYATGSAVQIGGMLLQANGGGAVGRLVNTSARVKLVNASVDTTSADFSVDSSVPSNASGIAYQAGSPYLAETSTSTSNTVVSHTLGYNFSGTSRASATVALDGGRDYTIVATGSAGSYQLFTAYDDNIAPASGNAKLRFINAVPSGSTMDGYIDGTVQVTAIGASSQSKYVTATAGSHTLAFELNNTNTVTASLGGVTLASGGVYTIYLSGTTDAPTAFVVQDR